MQNVDEPLRDFIWRRAALANHKIIELLKCKGCDCPHPGCGKRVYLSSDEKSLERRANCKLSDPAKI